MKRLFVLLTLVAAAYTSALAAGGGVARADACNADGEWPNCSTECAITGNACDQDSDGDVDYGWICATTGNDCGDGGGSAPAPPWAIETPDGTVYIWDGGAGIYRHVPDSDTAFAMGLQWCGSDWCGTTHVNSPSDAGNCCGGDWPSTGGSGGVGVFDDTPVAEYGPNRAPQCVSGPIGGDGLYTGSLSMYVPYQGGQTFWYDVTVTITNVNVLGFIGTAQLYFHYPNGTHFDADLNALWPWQSRTITSTIYQARTPTNFWGGYLNVNYQLWVSADSDSVALAYQACLH
jgi:hypothetical protein